MDDGFESEDEIPVTQPKAKTKRKLTQAQLDQLAKAREKANAVRRKNAVTKQKKKQIAEMERQREDEELDIKLNQLHGSREPAKTKASKPKKSILKPAPAPAPAPESVTETESSSSEEEEIIEKKVKKPKKKVKKKKKIVKYVTDSSDDDEDYTPSKAEQIQSQSDVYYDQQMARAYASLFPSSYLR